MFLAFFNVRHTLSSWWSVPLVSLRLFSVRYWMNESCWMILLFHGWDVLIRLHHSNMCEWYCGLSLAHYISSRWDGSPTYDIKFRCCWCWLSFVSYLPITAVFLSSLNLGCWNSHKSGTSKTEHARVRAVSVSFLASRIKKWQLCVVWGLGPQTVRTSPKRQKSVAISHPPIKVGKERA